MIRLKYYLLDLKEKIGALYDNPIFAALEANKELNEGDMAEMEHRSDALCFSVELYFGIGVTMEITFPTDMTWFRVKTSTCLNDINNCDYRCKGFQRIETNSHAALTAFIQALPGNFPAANHRKP